MYFKRSKHKYGAKKVTSLCYYGFSHRSQLERSVCALIRLRELAGEIEHLQHEAHVPLSDANITFIPDFKCWDKEKNQVLYVEAKGMETPEYRIKRRLWMHYGPGTLEVWKGNAARPKLTETIIPIVKSASQ